MKRRFRQMTAMITMVGPVVFWLCIFVLLPVIYVFVISFLKKGPIGGVIPEFTTGNYTGMLQFLYARIFLRSAWTSLLVTVLCLLLGYPLAYIITRVGNRMKVVLVMLVMLPFWTNSLIRIYGWITILRTDGLINKLLTVLGIIREPLQLLYNDGAVMIGMVYTLFPFMVLPLYSSLEKLDHSLLEAASDLGGKPHRAFIRVTLPLTFPGIFAGIIQVFIPTMSYFFITDIMGGSKAMMIGNLINNQFITARNWPFGAALSIILILLTILLMRLYRKAGGKLEDMA
jgi:spermidine/putrescine transport system permease protein